MITEDYNRLKKLPQITTLHKIKSCQLVVLTVFLHITKVFIDYHIVTKKMKLKTLKCLLIKGLEFNFINKNDYHILPQ